MTMPFALTDHQLKLVMTAAAPLGPIEARHPDGADRRPPLRLIGVHHPTDGDIERAIKAAMAGLLQE